jgi:hypothetical protein
MQRKAVNAIKLQRKRLKYLCQLLSWHNMIKIDKIWQHLLLIVKEYLHSVSGITAFNQSERFFELLRRCEIGIVQDNRIICFP